MTWSLSGILFVQSSCSCDLYPLLLTKGSWEELSLQETRLPPSPGTFRAFPGPHEKGKTYAPLSSTQLCGARRTGAGSQPNKSLAGLTGFSLRLPIRLSCRYFRAVWADPEERSELAGSGPDPKIQEHPQLLCPSSSCTEVSYDCRNICLGYKHQTQASPDKSTQKFLFPLEKK